MPSLYETDRLSKHQIQESSECFILQPSPNLLYTFHPSTVLVVQKSLSHALKGHFLSMVKNGTHLDVENPANLTLKAPTAKCFLAYETSVSIAVKEFASSILHW